jgi:hypothetical protein
LRWASISDVHEVGDFFGSHDERTPAMTHADKPSGRKPGRSGIIRPLLMIASIAVNLARLIVELLHGT